MDTLFEQADKQLGQMVEKYGAPSNMWLDAVESALAPDGRELTRRVLQGHVDSRGNGDIGPCLVAADGTILTHRRLMKTILNTVYGKISLHRVGYSRPGHPLVFPLDAVLNLPTSSFSYGLQRFVARRASMNSFDEVLSFTEEATGVHVGKRQGCEIVQQCAVDFDLFYTASGDATTNGSEPILVLTTDGKGIVMRPEGLRDATRERARKAQQKMQTRLSKGEKSNRKRMAQVASIYEIARFRRTPREIIDDLARRQAAQRRPRPRNKRVWASVEKDSDEVIKAMFKEAHQRDPKHNKEWIILVDGNKHQLRLVKALAKREGVSAAIILDIIHVIEYLWVSARLFNDEASHECERWVEGKLEEILHSHAGRVGGSIKILAAKRNLEKDKRKIARDCAHYLASNRAYMDYARYLERGYPIATGVIEGACRYLIKDRMDLTGARWGLSGAESVLKLRSLVKSGDFDEYWEFHLQKEFERNHLSKLADQEQLQPLLHPLAKVSHHEGIYS
jgi:hypothetical protein